MNLQSPCYKVLYLPIEVKCLIFPIKLTLCSNDLFQFYEPDSWELCKFERIRFLINTLIYTSLVLLQPHYSAWDHHWKRFGRIRGKCSLTSWDMCWTGRGAQKQTNACWANRNETRQSQRQYIVVRAITKVTQQKVMYGRFTNLLLMSIFTWAGPIYTNLSHLVK